MAEGLKIIGKDTAVALGRVFCRPVLMTGGSHMLEEIIPFRYLTPQQREALLGDVSEEVYEPDAVLLEQGDSSDNRVLLVIEGSVVVRDSEGGLPGQSSIVRAGHYIGERAALFGEPRAVEVRALDHVRVLAIPGERFMRLIHESTPFAREDLSTWRHFYRCTRSSGLRSTPMRRALTPWTSVHSPTRSGDFRTM
jgi:hypothetical protein